MTDAPFTDKYQRKNRSVKRPPINPRMILGVVVGALFFFLIIWMIMMLGGTKAVPQDSWNMGRRAALTLDGVSDVCNVGFTRIGGDQLSARDVTMIQAHAASCKQDSDPIVSAIAFNKAFGETPDRLAAHPLR